MRDAYWLVAKYVPDLRRQEPRNFGVVLVAPTGVIMRFKGERIEGTIDGRTVRLGQDLPAYRAWIDYWKHQLGEPVPAEDVSHMLGRQPDQPLFLEFGGRVLDIAEQDADPESLLDEIYDILVSERKEGESGPSLSHLSQSLFRKVGLTRRITQDFKFESQVNDRVDVVHFDYKYDNGKAHLLQNVSLSLADDRSWSAVHAATWSFERATSEGYNSLTALVKGRTMDEDYDHQFQLIESFANVVDVTSIESAAALSEILSLK